MTTGGTGALVIGSASSGYQALAAGDNALLFPYVIEDGTAWETGYGTYTSSGTSFARTTRNASSTGSALNVTTAAFLYIDWTATIAQSAERASRGFISGCELAWVSASAIDSGPGKVHIEGL
ncbi:MAG: hypothetical protein H0T80_01335, partial [Betaproteobacteria bacterium]|nr:hypothetical protein [Betaproteobacteria bacterium]